jgi:hypothetical protein
VPMPDPNPLLGAYALGAFIGGVPPAAPSRLTATASSYNRIDLAWEDNSNDELGFSIERRVKGETEFAEIIQTEDDATSYSDRAVAGKTTYEYRIRAFNEASFSTYAVSQEPATTDKDKFHWCFIGTLIGELFK